MALQNLLDLSANRKKIGISEARLRATMPYIRQYIAFWREYPDLFLDFLQTGGDPTKKKALNLFFYQRLFLRVTMRYKQVYMVFPRAYSKSFLSILTLLLRCILYPGAKLFVTSGGKEQAAGIIKDKVQEICNLVPAIGNEIDWSRGQTKEGKDYCEYIFKNGSRLDNIAARESSRGKRRHGGLIEECVGVDGTVLNEVIIPIMAIDRRCQDGTTHPEETLNKSQIFVTTAGWKNSFPYEKLITLLVRMIVEPNKAFVMGGTWRIPVLMGLQSKTFIQDQKNDGTFNEISFGREYESRWAGTVDDAFFNGELFDKRRTLKRPEYEFHGLGKDSICYYVISADIGRKGCATVVTVFKVHRGVKSIQSATSNVVNIFTLDDMHFEDQVIFMKKLYYKYHARRLVIDGNGIGMAIIDDMVKSQTDPETGDTLPDFGIMNDEENFYKKYQTPYTEQDAVYIIKANAPLNTEAHSNVQALMSSNKVQFLVDERTAKIELMATQAGQKMTPEERAEYLRPYTLTSILKEEMMNLRETNEGVNIILKQANVKIKKDKFSSLEYGLWYIKQEEDKSKKRSKRRLSDFMFHN